MFSVWHKYVKQRKYMIVVWTLSLIHPLHLQLTETWQQYVGEILKLYLLKATYLEEEWKIHWIIPMFIHYSFSSF